MKVCYDREKDIVSIYFEENVKNEDNTFIKKQENTSTSSNLYDSEKAANLILDTVDIVSNSSIVGFRVFNASKYYDRELLNVADEENLSDAEASLRPSEKVIATVTREGIV
ncbi:hypothetical protein [Clostridium cylindrosporum]|uniref:DUF2283 domain-containing protein n=1 Tax=Clostridium cylindrosporum DSM 605 TaxID=1121307 RepID=A0A0J8G514_CLOCY|nr:hypothetical protein [Clostridium cylindrosporum]KMT22761.1 hypothetical protein CLCY_11c00950 [Clostridium cylindrosporum DSM 605]